MKMKKACYVTCLYNIKGSSNNQNTVASYQHCCCLWYWLWDFL